MLQYPRERLYPVPLYVLLNLNIGQKQNKKDGWNQQLKINTKFLVEKQRVMKAVFKIVLKIFLFTNICGYLCRPFKNWRDSVNKIKTYTMSKLHFTTKSANEATVTRNWYVVDGTNQTVGRICAKIAAVLRGKNKAYYTPHVDCGDFVIVTNCDKVKFTGNKMDEKVYLNYSGYPGGKKEEIAKDLIKRRPEVIVERAVKGMLPKNRLGRKVYKKLFVYAGDKHPHTAQQPQPLTF
jgi:large subunit ribosomal protein L13